MRRFSILLLLPLLAWGQIGFSGEVAANRMWRLDGGAGIDLPFRLLDGSLSYGLGDLELRASMEVESRWNPRPATAEEAPAFWQGDSGQLAVKLEEAYVTWYPRFGEVKLGNMIHAWGAADANNPTDNLSPYDFYYLFLTGTDRKNATLSASVKSYLGDFILEGVVLPQHAANRIPYGEPVFPIALPQKPAEDDIAEIENEIELGVRAKVAMSIGDVSASYFRGHDRFSGLLAWQPSLAPRFKYGYRETSVLGMDAVFFPGNWTLRAEMGYFQTENPFDDAAWTVFETEADYLQYVVQAEYLFANELQLMIQLLGSTITSIEGTTLLRPTPENPVPQQVELTEEAFQAGMGMPFGMLSDRALIVSTLATLFDSSLELTGMAMFNLEETEDYHPIDSGLLLNLQAVYTIFSGFDVETRVIVIEGDGDHQFAQMSDFSNVSLGLRFNF